MQAALPPVPIPRLAVSVERVVRCSRFGSQRSFLPPAANPVQSKAALWRHGLIFVTRFPVHSAAARSHDCNHSCASSPSRRCGSSQGFLWPIFSTSFLTSPFRHFSALEKALGSLRGEAQAPASMNCFSRAGGCLSLILSRGKQLAGNIYYLERSFCDVTPLRMKS